MTIQYASDLFPFFFFFFYILYFKVVDMRFGNFLGQISHNNIEPTILKDVNIRFGFKRHFWRHFKCREYNPNMKDRILHVLFMFGIANNRV